MTIKGQYSHQIIISDPDRMLALMGNQDQHLDLFESFFPVELSVRGEVLTIKGEDQQEVDQVSDIVEMLLPLFDKGVSPKAMDIMTAIKMAQDNRLEFFLNLYDEVIGRAADGRAIRVKNYGQSQYVEAIKKGDITFGIGPAGTGKTFLAVVVAVQALRDGLVKKIILTRPAVEAGESLGFLPGDLKEKVDPYLRPIYDALYRVLGTDHTNRLMERGIIEIAPLAYMRGRTLDDAFVILDEAQNTTVAQMKMFLTRLGFGSKMIINGDQTQIDLPYGVKSGLVDAVSKLASIRKVSIIRFDSQDVVRHPLVAEIIRAYGQKSQGNLVENQTPSDKEARFETESVD